jgi:hypothetical protein
MSEQVDNEASELMEALDNAFPVPPSPPPLPPFLEPLSALCTDNGDAYTSTLLQTPQHTAENMDVEVSHVPRNIPKSDILQQAIHSIGDSDQVHGYPLVNNQQQLLPEMATVNPISTSETFRCNKFNSILTLRNTQLRQQRYLINKLQKELGEAQQQIADLSYSFALKENLNEQIQLKLDFQTFQTSTATNLINIQKSQLDFSHKFIQSQSDSMAKLAAECGALKVSKVHILYQLRSLQAKHM